MILGRRKFLKYGGVSSSDGSEPSWLEQKDFQLGSWLFHFSSKSKIDQKRAEIRFSVEDLFLIIFIITLYWKWLNYAAKSYYSTLKTPFLLRNSDKWTWNWLESCYWSKIGKLDCNFKNLQFFYIHIVGIVSSVSARKLKCPSSARLGTFIARARSSRKIPARTHLYI